MLHRDILCVQDLRRLSRNRTNSKRPKTTRQNQKSTSVPRSSLKPWCRAAGGKWGIAAKYSALPITIITRYRSQRDRFGFIRFSDLVTE